ncbi:SDR family oxidoreductase [Lachnospiraceae bacterium OttesenSCG-928-D06]|nr:SDR family oxidoreductase [Lachnospiraceae bacterium OttesenSCG-928-D06]
MNILITGASRGLGYFLTKKYLEDGNVVYAGVRNIEGDKVRELKEKFPETVHLLPLDVAETKSVEDAAKRVKCKLDILINNAAIHSETSFLPLEETDIDECLFVYNVNALGSLRTVKAFSNHLKEGGEIINITSESGSIATAGRTKEFDYCMSKAAMNMGAKLLQNYLKDRNIKVLSVHPGWMRTDMGGANARLDPEENAGNLIRLFQKMNHLDGAEFIDYMGEVIPW